MNYLTNFGLGETAEDEMCKIQIYRRMESAFDHEFTPEQLESLFSDIGYTSPSRGNYEDVEQEVLYRMYLEHLKMTEREFTMTNEQRQNEFEKILNSLLTKNWFDCLHRYQYQLSFRAIILLRISIVSWFMTSNFGDTKI